MCRVGEQWMRCQVLCEEEGGVLVVLLDRGGTINVPATALRQIRYDYMTLPFQATQCFLQGIQPSDNGEYYLQYLMLPICNCKEFHGCKSP